MLWSLSPSVFHHFSSRLVRQSCSTWYHIPSLLPSQGFVFAWFCLLALLGLGFFWVFFLYCHNSSQTITPGTSGPEEYIAVAAHRYMRQPGCSGKIMVLALQIMKNTSAPFLQLRTHNFFLPLPVLCLCLNLEGQKLLLELRAAGNKPQTGV